jgi:hypothetical protein
LENTGAKAACAYQEASGSCIMDGELCITDGESIVCLLKRSASAVAVGREDQRLEDTKAKAMCAYREASG